MAWYLRKKEGPRKSNNAFQKIYDNGLVLKKEETTKIMGKYHVLEKKTKEETRKSNSYLRIMFMFC